MYLDTKALREYIQTAFPKRENITDYIIRNLDMTASRSIYRHKIESGKFINILSSTGKKVIRLLNEVEDATGEKVLSRDILYDELPRGGEVYNETDARRDMMQDVETTTPASQAPEPDTAAGIVAELRRMNETQRAMLMEMRDLSGYLEAICKEFNIAKNPASAKS